MTENLSPHEAARVLAQASSYEASLLQRTEGLTAMIWGVVGPAIFLTYAFAERLTGFPDWGWAVLWIPWIAAGGLMSFALWRSAGLSMPHLQDPITPAGYTIRFVVVILALSLVFAIWNPEHYGAPLLIIGAMYVAFASVNPFGNSGRGRAVLGAIGAALLATGGIAILLPETDLGFTATIAMSGVAPLAGGLWQTLRG